MVTSAKVGRDQYQQLISLPVPREFDFYRCLKFLNRSTRECLHRVHQRKWLKLLKLEGKSLLLEVSMNGNMLNIKCLNNKMSPEQQKQIISFITEVFDLERDLGPFYRHMEGNPVMSKVADSYYGLRLIGIPDLFEALSWCVIGQQINLAFAYELKRRLVESKGERLSFQGTDYFMFPAAEVVAAMDPEEFVPWKFSNSKARYLIGIAREVQIQNLVKDQLIAMGEHQALEQLTSVRGIGPWSAHYVMMKCLRFPSAYPMADVGLQNAIKVQQGGIEKPDTNQLEALGRQWHPWEAYATFYLWHSLIK